MSDTLEKGKSHVFIHQRNEQKLVKRQYILELLQLLDGFQKSRDTQLMKAQLYLEERQAKRLREKEDLTVSTLILKKKGRPLLLGN